MKFLLMLALCVGVAYSAALIGQNKCTYGPSYWCKDYHSAKECGTLDHCKTKQWSAKTADTEICTLCKDGVAELQTYLKKKTTRDFCKDKLLILCSNIPEAEISAECKKLVNADFDMIYNDILALASPELICSGLGLCMSMEKYVNLQAKNKLKKLMQADSNDMVLSPFMAPVPLFVQPSSAGAPCDDCHAFLTDVKNVISKNKTITDMWLKELNTVCTSLGPFEPPCLKYSEELLSQISANSDVFFDVTAACDSLDLCTFTKSNDNDLCSDCQNFFADVQHLLKTNQTVVTKYTNMLKEGCSELPDEPTQLVDKIVEKLAAFYCLQKPYSIHEECERYMTKVIKASIEALKYKCKELVQAEVSKALSAFEKVSTKEICMELYFCPDGHNDHVFTDQLKTSLDTWIAKNKHQEPLGGDKCSDCHAFVTDVQGLINNKSSTIMNLISLIDEQCDTLPEAESILCKKLVEEATPIVENAITDNDVDTICSTIMMCQTVAKKLASIAPTGNVCDDCVAFVKDWQDTIQNDPATISELNSMIADECYMLPSPVQALTSLTEETEKLACEAVPFFLRDECYGSYKKAAKQLIALVNVTCQSLVKNQIPQLWNLLSYTDAEEVCQTLAFCDAKPKRLPMDSKLTLTPVKQTIKFEDGGDYCTDCKTFIADIQSDITNHKQNIDSLVDLVKQQCDMIGPGVSEACKLLVDQAAPAVENLIVDNDCGSICSTIMMCTAGKASRPIVTGDECDDCLAFAADWNMIAKDNNTINILSSLIQEQCYNLDAALQKVCLDVVKQYLPVLWGLVRETSPSDMCATLYFCDAKKPSLNVMDDVQSILRHASPARKPVAKKVSATAECDVCKFVEDELSKLLETNKTEGAIKGVLEKVCNLFSADIRTECESFVGEYEADIIDFVLQELSAINLCAKLGLCNATSTTAYTQLTASNTTVECDTCQFVVDYLRHKLVNNATEEDIVGALEKVCTVMSGSLQSQCTSLVSQYGEYVAALLLGEIISPDHICDLLKLCSNKQMLLSTSDVNCEVCLAVVEAVDIVFEDETIKKDIVDGIEGLCSKIFSDATKVGQCKQLVDQYGDQLYNLLLKELTPQFICQSITVCPHKANVSILKIQPKISANTSPAECALCKEVFEFVEKKLGDNRTEAEILKVLDVVCKIVPEGAERDKCVDFINKYTKTIITLLLNGVSPDMICMQLKLCSSVMQVQYPPKYSTTCAICEKVAIELEDMITPKSTEPEIKAALLKVCSRLPTDYKKQCDLFINMYLDDAWDVLIHHFAPQLLCMELGLCVGKAQPKIPVVTQTVKDSVECDLCQDVATFLDSELEANSTEEEIKDALMSVCSKISSITTECDALVAQYFDQIYQYIIEAADLTKLCADIGLCPKTKMVQVSDDTECDLCKAAVVTLKKLLNENSTKSEVEDALKSVCNDLGKIGEECDALVEQYFDLVWQYIVDGVDFDQLCFDLKLCTKSSKMVQVSDDTECDLCKAAVVTLKKLLNENSTKIEVEDALKSVCNDLGKIGEECDALIEQYFDLVWQYIVDGVDFDQLCFDLKLCTKSSEMVQVSDDTECDLCKAAVVTLKKLLNENSTKSEVEDALKSVCNDLGKIGEECDALVEQYFDLVWQYIVDGVDFDQLCFDLKLCTKSSVELQKIAIKDSVDCELCKDLISEIRRYVAKNTTRDAVKADLLEICSKFGGLKDNCTNLINEHFMQVYYVVLGLVDPDMLCTAVKLCANDYKVLKASGCSLCTTVMTTVEKELSSEASEKEIIDVVSNVCSLVHGSIHESCEVYINEYGPAVIALIIQEVKPQEVCSVLGMCAKTNVVAYKKKLLTKGDKCEACQVSFTTLRSFGYGTEKQAKLNMLRMCSAVSMQYTEFCEEMLSEYYPTIVKNISDISNPAVLCSKIKMCERLIGSKHVW